MVWGQSHTNTEWHYRVRAVLPWQTLCYINNIYFQKTFQVWGASAGAVACAQLTNPTVVGSVHWSIAICFFLFICTKTLFRFVVTSVVWFQHDFFLCSHVFSCCFKSIRNQAQTYKKHLFYENDVTMSTFEAEPSRLSEVRLQIIIMSQLSETTQSITSVLLVPQQLACFCFFYHSALTLPASMSTCYQPHQRTCYPSASKHCSHELVAILTAVTEPPLRPEMHIHRQKFLSQLNISSLLQPLIDSRWGNTQLQSSLGFKITRNKTRDTCDKGIHQVYESLVTMLTIWAEPPLYSLAQRQWVWGGPDLYCAQRFIYRDSLPTSCTSKLFNSAVCASQ